MTMNPNTSRMTFGPFTPQETNRIAEALKAENIDFEIVKDQAEENNFTRNDFSNIVTRAEYRTETYLAQIFYFAVAIDSENNFHRILEAQNLIVPAAAASSHPVDLDLNPQASEQEDQAKLQKASLSQAAKLRWTARSIILAMIAVILIMWVLGN